VLVVSPSTARPHCALLRCLTRCEGSPCPVGPSIFLQAGRPAFPRRRSPQCAGLHPNRHKCGALPAVPLLEEAEVLLLVSAAKEAGALATLPSAQSPSLHQITRGTDETWQAPHLPPPFCLSHSPCLSSSSSSSSALTSSLPLLGLFPWSTTLPDAASPSLRQGRLPPPLPPPGITPSSHVPVP